MMKRCRLSQLQTIFILIFFGTIGIFFVVSYSELRGSYTFEATKTNYDDTHYARKSLEFERLRSSDGLLQNAKNSRASATFNPENMVVFYNRVPKTGSTSLMGVAYDLCKENRFSAIHVNISKNSHIMGLADQAELVQNVSNWVERKPAIYHGHVAFLDFTKFGHPNPIYINLIREPLDRLVSYYYFLRYGDDFRPKLQRKKMGNTETFDQCVERAGKDCDSQNLWIQIPFFCGHAAECRRPGSRWALEQAKRNLVDHYLVVGITEQLEEFVAVLEAALPRFFNGATTLFATGTRSHMRRTKQKVAPSQETMQRMRNSMEYVLEYEFYEFASEQFEFIKKRTLTTKENESFNGAEVFGDMPRKREFHYEKIKP